MPTYTGTIRHNDLEGGFYELAADDGTVYRLEGDVNLDAGTRVRVDGTEESGGFGIHMTGSPALKIRKIEKI
jgi:hypothetical protein